MQNEEKENTEIRLLKKGQKGLIHALFSRLGFLPKGAFQGMAKIGREKPRGLLKAVFGGGV